MEGTTVLMLLVVALAVLITVVILVGLRRGPAAYYELRNTHPAPDQAKRLEQLETALGDRYRVLPRSRLIDFIDVKSRLSRRTRTWAHERILEACFDFALLDRNSPKTIGILMGDDADRPRRERRQRDFVRKLCESLGMPVVTLDAVLASDPEYLRSAVERWGSTAPKAKASNSRQEPTLA